MTIANVNAGDPLDPAWGDSVADLLNGATATAYSPTLGGSGWAIGNGTRSGRYVVIGGVVLFAFNIVMGSTSTFGAASPTVTFPVTVNASGNYGAAIASNAVAGVIIDSSSGAQYDIRGVADTASQFKVYALSASGTYVQPAVVSSTVPMAWATGDQISMVGWAFMP